MRYGLVVCITLLAQISLAYAGLSPWLSIPLALAAVAVSAHALLRAPSPCRIRNPEPHLLVVESADAPGSDAWRGRFDTLYTSGFYCAFRIRDTARGRRIFGFFRDELDRDIWRRLQVTLRAR